MKTTNNTRIFKFIVIVVWSISSSFAISTNSINKEIIQAHVKFLCSDALEGRLTGSVGEKRATQYVADEFQRMGLVPAGDNGTYFQIFDFTAGVKLGKNNTLTIINRNHASTPLTLNQDWRPLAFSASMPFVSSELIFAGYGITAPAIAKLAAYDSYASLNVANKWVLVFRHISEKIPVERNRQLSRYTSLRYRVFNAKKHGAKGIIFVDPMSVDPRNELIKLAFTTSLSNSNIVVLSVKNNVINELLKSSNSSLQKMQASLDSGQSIPAPLLNGIKFIGQVDIEKIRQQGRNVLGKLKTGEKSAGIIVVGAHVDHLGRGNLGGSRGLKNEEGMIHSGADDNASGVASMLEAASALSKLKVHGNKDILFAAWSGEEFGVLGSSHFVTHTPKQQIDAAINLDMVGHLRQNLVLQGVASSSDWPAIIEKSHHQHLFNLISQNDPYLPTDSTPFYLHDIPTLNFFTGAHDNYHTARDRPATLNYAGIQNITAFLVDLILTMEDRQQAIAYQALQQKHDRPKRQMKMYLGTIPDYASADCAGVKLSGVAKNSPAETAGLQREDIIIELAGNKIHDIYDYTFALNALQAGQPVKLIALRGRNQVALTIAARYRE